MKFTNKQIIDIMNSIDGIANKKLPIKLLFAFNRNLPNLQKASEDYHKTLYSILSASGAKIEDISTSPQLQNQVGELLATETEVQIDTVTSAVFEQCDNERYDPLSLAELHMLSFMMKDEEPVADQEEIMELG